MDSCTTYLNTEDFEYQVSRAKKGKTGVDSNSQAERNGNGLDRSEIDDVEVDGNEIEDDEVGKKGQKISKSKNLSKFKMTVRSDFLTLELD